MNYKRTRSIIALLAVETLLLHALSGCADTAKGASTQENHSGTEDTAYLDAEDMFSYRDKEVGYDKSSAVAITLNDDAIACADASVKVSGSTVTITQEGTYLISGSLSDGQIIVDADKSAKLQLVLDQADITSKSSAPLYVKKADKVFVTLASGTTNKLVTASDYVAIDDSRIDATIFAKADLTLNGSGSLSVSSASGHGIVSKDDLAITGGTYTVTAAKHALSGKDSVRIADGTLTLSAGKDGIHSENTEDLEKGFIYIAGGDMHITCQSDGLDGDNTIQITGGSLEIAAGDDGIHSDSDLIIAAGTINITKSCEGLEGKTITISDGNIRVTASDDGLNAAGEGKALGGSNSSGNKNDSKNKGDRMPDAISSASVNPDEDKSGDGNDKNGELQQMPDNGQQNPSTDADSKQQRPNGSKGNRGKHDKFGGDGNFGGFGGDNGFGGDGNFGGFGGDNGFGGDGNFGDFGGPGGFGGGGFGGFDDGTDYNWIRIDGGTLYVDAGGDGLDSNGNLTVNGGEIYVYGPTNNGNGALDYGKTATITGGTIIAVGASGMAMNFGTDSTQGSMLITIDSSLAGGEVALTDKNGKTIVSCTPTKSYSSVLISTPALAAGETYTLTACKTTTTVEMSSLIYSNASGGFGDRGGFGGFGGGGGMQRPSRPGNAL